MLMTHLVEWFACVIPIEMFGVLTILCGVICVVFSFALLTPLKHYPSHQPKKPPDKEVTSLWWNASTIIMRTVGKLLYTLVL